MSSRGPYVSCLLDILPGVELLGMSEVYVWVFKKPPCCFPKWLYQFTFPLAKGGEAGWGEVLVSLQPCHCLVLSVFYFSHSVECMVLSHCDHTLNFPRDIEHLFTNSYVIYVCSLDTYLFKSFAFKKKLDCLFIIDSENLFYFRYYLSGILYKYFFPVFSFS